MLTITELNDLPKMPGVYKFFDKNKNLLYIGKATCLRSRVKSYFSSNVKNKRTIQMVQQINFIEYTVTVNATEARVLENNLILLLKPQFNIQIREESNFPVLELTLHDFPQLKLTNILKAKGQIFGPFSTKKAANEKLKIIQSLFKIRVCEDKEFKNRSSPCLLYQFKQCSAPCINKIDKLTYQENVAEAKELLLGDYKKLLLNTKLNMLNCAKDEEYEAAAFYRNIYLNLLQWQKYKVIHFRAKHQSFDLILTSFKDETLFIYIYSLQINLRNLRCYNLAFGT